MGHHIGSDGEQASQVRFGEQKLTPPRDDMGCKPPGPQVPSAQTVGSRARDLTVPDHWIHRCFERAYLNMIRL